MVVNVNSGSNIISGTAAPPRVYLHYLDRELLEAIGWIPTASQLRRFTNTLVLGLDSPLICVYPHLWESFDQVAPIIAELRMLQRYRVLEAVSSQKFFRDFLPSRRELFAHSQDRYRVYFRDPPEELLAISPGVFKPSDTTKFLLKRLPDLTRLRGHNALADYVGAAGEAKILLGEIDAVIRERGDRALTYTLFEKRLAAKVGLAAAAATRLRISELYTAHYLSAIHADVPTGVPGLAFFDGLSETFPQLDLRIMWQVLRLVGLSSLLDQPLTQHAWWEPFLALRGSPAHTLLVDLLLQVVNTVVSKAAPEDRATTDALRELCAAQLNRLAALDGLELGSPIEEQLLRMSRHLQQILAALGSRYIPNLGKMILASHSQPARTGRVLLLTAHDVETRAVEEEMSDGPLVAIQADTFSFYDLGTVGHNRVICAQVHSDSKDLHGAVVSAAKIIEELKPTSVIAVGVALKVQPSKAGTTNVLLSAQMSSYDIRLDGSNAVLLGVSASAERSTSPAWLLANARSSARECGGIIAHTGLMMCGPDIRDGPLLLDLLLDRDPDVLAAEAFGSGLQACQSAYLCNWLVVKGECKWADIVARNSAMERAAKSAAKVVLQMLSRQTC